MAGKLRDLPPLSTFVEEICAALGGTATASVLAEGQWPAQAIALDGRHVVLVRDHGWSLTVSLPATHSWSLQTRDEWREIELDFASAVRELRARHPRAISMADVIVTLAPALARSDAAAWEVSFPGTPVPAEAWLRSDDGRSVGLFQRTASVLVVVWVGDASRSRTIASPEALASLASWLAPQLVDQKRALEAAAVEVARRKALPLPAFAEVMARLRTGERIRVGGGRYHTTYFFAGALLRCEIFDEGHVEEHDATEDALQREIERSPDDFR